MPRILVTTDGPKASRQIVLDELILPEFVNASSPDVHFADQLIERLGWGIEDAARAEAALRDALTPTDYREVAAG